MVEGINFQKGTQFHSGEYIGSNEDEELYKGIMVFTVTGRKKYSTIGH